LLYVFTFSLSVHTYLAFSIFPQLYWNTTDIWYCVSLRYTKWWFDTHIYCKMVTRIKLVNTSITSDNYFFFKRFYFQSLHPMRGSNSQPWDQGSHALLTEPARHPDNSFYNKRFKIYSCSNFQVYNTCWMLDSQNLFIL